MIEVKYKKTSSLYKELTTYIKPFWPILLLGLIFNGCYALIDSWFTYMMRPFFDKGFIQTDLHFIAHIPLIIFCGITLRGLLGASGSYCMTYVARSVVTVLRQKVFKHILRLPAAYYDKALSGDLLSKILYDVEQVAQVSADVLTDLVQNTCQIIGCLTVMLVICWQLSLMFLLTVPFIGLIVNYTNKRIRKISHKIQKVMGEVTCIAAEVIEGYKVVRIFAGENYEVKKFHDVTENSKRQDLKVAVSKSINVFTVQFIIAIGISLIIFSAIKLSATISISAGSFVAIIAAMIQLIKPLKTLTTLNASMQRGLAGAESVFKILQEPIEPKSGELIILKTPIMIEFKDLSFAYNYGKPVLNNINFVIKAGTTVALIGPSGSGKTSLTSLLVRFYEPNAGQILLNNINIADIKLANLRKYFSLVSQHIVLFNDTVFKNIAYGLEGVSLEQVIAAAQLSFADEFIQHLPQGYNTIIGDNGLQLSGGQRQRIAIARAILKDAPILILDEATSALDNQSEAYIQKALINVMQNRTTLIVAHRLSTIKAANQIVVLHNGVILEQGNHESLLQHGGYYAKLLAKT
jgi:ATP-binding cassette, subfamily B, bacterial MsbA